MYLASLSWTEHSIEGLLITIEGKIFYQYQEPRGPDGAYKIENIRKLSNYFCAYCNRVHSCYDVERRGYITGRLI
jgi:molybdenum cofactor biosynthesis enzyme MoaA